MKSSIRLNIRLTWVEALLWIFFLTNLLQNQSVIFGLLNTILYALLVIGALLSATCTFRTLKNAHRELSRAQCVSFVVQMLACLAYVLTYVAVVLRPLF